MDCCPPGSSVHGILQLRILELSCHVLLQGIVLPGIEPASPELAGVFFTREPPGSPASVIVIPVSCSVCSAATL